MVILSETQKLLSFHYFLRSHDNSAVDSELSEQYHTLLAEYKEQEKYLSSVQQELNQVRYNLLNIILLNFRDCFLPPQSSILNIILRIFRDCFPPPSHTFLCHSAI